QPNEAIMTKYYDGKIEYTFQRMNSLGEKSANGGKDYRADWYCPQCGKHKIDRWCGQDGHPGGCPIAMGCKWGLWIERGSWIRVHKLDEGDKVPLKKVPLRDETPPPKIARNGVQCFQCGCCGIEGDDLAANDTVDVHYRSGEYVGRGIVVRMQGRGSNGHE